MSLGYSIGDIIAIGRLAWNLYKSCKEAPESFGNIAIDVASLHAVLKEAEETVFAQPLSPTAQVRLKTVGDGCYHVLKDLDNLVKKYEGLGSQTRRTWDRMRWGTEDVSELRVRLISSTLLLNTWISTSQVRVEKKLENYSQEFREGRQLGSVISHQTPDSLCVDEKQVWRAIRKELEDIGITVAAFDANKDFIFEWLTKAVASGAFDEQPFGDSPSAVPCMDVSDEKHNVVQITSGGLLELGERLGGASHWKVPLSAGPSKAGVMLSSSDEIGVLSGAKVLHIPRVAPLIARLSRPNKSLIKAIEHFDESKACRILNDESKVARINSRTFANAICGAASRGQERVVHLLPQKGADVNATDKYGRPPLRLASECGRKQVVRLLLESDVDINAVDSYGQTSLWVASRWGHEQVVQLLLEKGADITASDSYGATALWVASNCGREQVVRLLLEKGADVNTANSRRETSLYIASQSGREQVVQLLLENGADTSMRNVSGHTALQTASREGHKRIVQLLELYSA